MAFKHISLLCSAKGVINGSHGWYGFFFAQAKTHITRSGGWYGFFWPGKNPLSQHSENSAVLPLTPHRQTCQKEKCMINRLWYGNFHIISHINPRHLYQPEDLWSSGWYRCLGLIWGMIWKLTYNNLIIMSNHFLTENITLLRLASWCYMPVIKCYLNLKMPRKTTCENVICLCHLLYLLATFQTYFLHIGKRCGPRSDCC